MSNFFRIKGSIALFFTFLNEFVFPSSVNMKFTNPSAPPVVAEANSEQGVDFGSEKKNSNLKSNNDINGIIGFVDHWTMINKTLHKYYSHRDKHSLWDQITADIRRYTNGRYETLLLYYSSPGCGGDFDCPFRKGTIGAHRPDVSSSKLINIIPCKSVENRIKNILRLYKKYYNYDVYQWTHDYQMGHGLLDVCKLIENGLLKILNTICDNCVVFSIDDLCKYDCHQLLKSCNAGIREKDSFFRAERVFGFGNRNKTYDVIEETYLYKEIIVKKLGLTIQLNDEQFKEKPLSSTSCRKSYWKLVSDSNYDYDDVLNDGIGRKIKNCKFKHLVEYFGVDFVKRYLLSNITFAKFDIQAKRCKTAPVAEQDIATADDSKLMMVHDN